MIWLFQLQLETMKLISNVGHCNLKEGNHLSNNINRYVGKYSIEMHKPEFSLDLRCNSTRAVLT